MRINQLIRSMIVSIFFLIFAAHTAAASKMYWIHGGEGEIPNGTMQQANLDGTGIDDLITDLDSSTGIAVDVADGMVYWASKVDGENNGGTIQRANIDGSGIEVLVTEFSEAAFALDVAAGKMYWTGDRAIQRADLDGSGVEIIMTGIDRALGIALDVAGGKMYWTNEGEEGSLLGNGTIQRANLDGSGVADTLVRGLFGPAFIALDVANGKMYWTNEGEEGSLLGSGTIQRATLDGTEVQTIVTGIDDPNSIDLDASGGKIYWGDGSEEASTGTIHRANLDGGDVEDLVIGLDGPLLITLALDDDMSGPADLTALADLTGTLTKVALKEKADGNKLKVKLTVSNMGTVIANGPFFVQLWLSDDARLSIDDEALDFFTIKKIKPGKSKKRTFQVRGLGAIAGKSIFVSLDGGGAIAESNESNNILAWSPVIQIVSESMEEDVP